jgi:hypothetical protein
VFANPFGGTGFTRKERKKERKKGERERCENEAIADFAWEMQEQECAR